MAKTLFNRKSGSLLLDIHLLGDALIYGFGVLYIFGVIPEWGQWYSHSPFYSAQGDALLHGDFALSHSLSDEDHDLAWSGGGIQQVWGLGIPILRLPFTVLAHLFGYDAFPEHVATGLVLSIIGYLVLFVLVRPPILRKEPVPDILNSLAVAALLLLFPPFLSLFHTNFWVYEEATMHTYLYGILEAILLLQYLRQPSKRQWLILMLIAGFGAFIRPTLVFYGFATWLVATLSLFWPSEEANTLLSRETDGAGQNQTPFAEISKINGPCSNVGLARALWTSARHRFGLWVLGSFLFFLGVLALMWTNQVRFGSPSEFGHSLNVQLERYDGSLYATRFDHPFEAAPFPVVLKELVGALFFVKNYYVTDDYYQANMFWGQADLPRMREMYFKTYDWTYILLLGVAVILMMYWLFCLFRRRLKPQDAPLLKFGMWAFISLGPIVWFYLRVPGMMSRYLIDFAPGIVVLIAVVWLVAARLRGVWRMVAFFSFAIWMILEITSLAKTTLIPDSLSIDDLAKRHKFGTISGQQIDIGSQTTGPGCSGIPDDGIGWSANGIKPLVIVFVQNPQFLEIDLEVTPQAGEQPDPNWVRAKIGLDFLNRESVVKEGNTWHIRFSGPRTAFYRHSIQPAFIAVVPNSHLADQATPWILRRVRWRT